MHDSKQVQRESAPPRAGKACSVGDDGFQSMTARFTGPILTPGDLGNLHELVLLREFLEGPRGLPNVNKNGTRR
jgi:hypothetical protein